MFKKDPKIKDLRSIILHRIRLDNPLEALEQQLSFKNQQNKEYFKDDNVAKSVSTFKVDQSSFQSAISNSKFSNLSFVAHAREVKNA